MNLELVKEKITNCGLKFTHQRMVIFLALIQSESHPSAEQVHEEIKISNPSISLATVYKTLDSFVQAGILRKTIDQNGVMRFDSKLDAHSHLYCKTSHEIRDYKNEKFEKLLQDFIEANDFEGYEIDEINVVFKGHKKEKNY
ncbi:transcriptional repressor [Belliella sp. DSM 111904]|uniref:Transcriptional repressor n=1 Tax=Belliella filtrata TaxID=2923435 RepID=A0ABS9V0L8_9BACT|nr:transcriptional repressor [Belliella filtrata]MCH7409947.1 transcriptional repressor [Belliella filtrata]